MRTQSKERMRIPSGHHDGFMEDLPAEVAPPPVDGVHEARRASWSASETPWALEVHNVSWARSDEHDEASRAGAQSELLELDPAQS